MNVSIIPNLLGFISLVLYVLSLSSGILRIVFPNLRSTHFFKFVTKYRKEIGISAFLFGLIHGIIISVIRRINFFDLQTYRIYFQGIFMLLIFTILAVTSNNWSIRKLKSNWKKLHSLTYIVLILLPWHILDKMSGHWSWITPLSLFILSITLFFFLKKSLQTLN